MHFLNRLLTRGLIAAYLLAGVATVVLGFYVIGALPNGDPLVPGVMALVGVGLFGMGVKMLLEDAKPRSS